MWTGGAANLSNNWAGWGGPVAPSSPMDRTVRGLQREPSSVVDPELRERQSDLLFSARLHGGAPLLL